MPVQKDKQKRDEMRAAVVTKAQEAADATAASEDGEAEVSPISPQALAPQGCRGTLLGAAEGSIIT